MILPNILNNLNKYGIIPSTGKQNILLLKQNKQLIDEIRIMKTKLSNEAYASANIFYRKIIKEVNIKLLRVLLREQYYNNLDNNLDINFLFDYDDDNLININFFRQIIFNRKIRNIVKHAVLKKFTMEDEEDIEALYNYLIDKLDKLDLSGVPNKNLDRCSIIEGLVSRRAEFIDLAKRFTGGGNNILVGGAMTDLVSLFVLCILSFNDQTITEIAKKCISAINKSDSNNIKEKINEILDDPQITPRDKPLYMPYVANVQNKKKIEIEQKYGKMSDSDKEKELDAIFVSINSSKLDEVIRQKFIIFDKRDEIEVRHEEDRVEEVRDEREYKKEVKDEKEYESLNNMLECKKIDDVICDIESKDINNIHLYLDLLDKTRKDLYCNHDLFKKIIFWLRQYSKSIESHTLETLGDGRKDYARIIFGAYIQLIEDDNGGGTIYKLDNISFEDVEWRNNGKPCIYMPVHEQCIIISLIKATYDYQQLIKTKETKKITISPGGTGHFDGNIDFPSNVYTVKAVLAHDDIDRIKKRKSEEIIKIWRKTVKGKNPPPPNIVKEAEQAAAAEEHRLKYLSAIGYYHSNTRNINYEVNTNVDLDKFKEEKCPIVEIKDTIPINSEYYKKYLKYKKKYFKSR